MPDSTAGMPKDPVTQLMEGAAQLHEFYTVLVKAGFTEEQAMQIVVAKVTQAPR